MNYTRSESSVTPQMRFSTITAIAILIPIAHATVFPYGIHIHPDTTGLIVSGVAMAEEGRSVQPFRWDYVFEHLGKVDISSDQPIVKLEGDYRVMGVNYPPGYSWIVAGGKLIGLATHRSCQLAFYAAMATAAFCWLMWASRWRIPLPVALIGLSPLIMNGPATVTDPFGYLAAVALLLILSSDYQTRLIVVGFLIMASADMTRYAAILLIFFWFGAWMFRPITWMRRFWVCVSCAGVVAIDAGWKFLISGGLDPMSEFSGGLPNPREIAQACVYSVTGGWTPVSTWLKVLVVAFASLGMAGVILAALRKQFPRWVGDILLIQAATAFVLTIAQYKYGADFTQAPVSIARYWRYCAPGLICVHMFGLTHLTRSLQRKEASDSSPTRLLPSFTYAIVILMSLIQWNIADREKWQAYKVGSDNFLRRSMNSDIHAYLEEHELVAVLADNHESVFGAMNVSQQKIKSVYYMSGFEASTSGQLALVLNSSKRGLMVKEKLDSELELLDFVEITPKKNISLYRLPSETRVIFESVDHREQSPKSVEPTP